MDPHYVLCKYVKANRDEEIVNQLCVAEGKSERMKWDGEAAWETDGRGSEQTGLARPRITVRTGTAVMDVRLHTHINMKWYMIYPFSVRI